jgi:hypothetical protein
MNIDDYINQAIIELKNSNDIYIMFKNLSFMQDLNSEDEFKKIRYQLIKSEPFELHSEFSIKFSSVGLEIINNYKDWYEYKIKKNKKKFDYWKVITGICAVGMLILSLLTYKSNSEKKELKIENDSLKAQIDLKNKEINELNSRLLNKDINTLIEE